MISHRNIDAYKKKVPAELRPQINRLRKSDSRIRSSYNRNGLGRTTYAMKLLSSRISLEFSVRNTVENILKKFFEKNETYLKGRRCEILAAAAIYTACRIKSNSFSLQEITDKTMIDKTKISKYQRDIVSTLNIKLPPRPPDYFIPKISSELNICHKDQQSALNILKRANRSGFRFSGQNPLGVAAAVLYLQCKGRKTQKELSEAAGITDVTLRNQYKKLLATLNHKREK